MNFEKIQEFETFLSRYQNIKREQTAHVEDFKSAFHRLIGEFQQKRNEVYKEARNKAPGFNVFQVLGLSRYENRTHSAMLAHLFSPRGLHGQGYLFLTAFLEHCATLDNNFPRLPREKVEASRWQIVTEESIAGSRMDVVLRCPELGFLCVIENKIDAFEQHRQLARYQKWMDTQQEAFPEQALIYLTVSGYASQTIDENRHYLRLSYQNDIKIWLGNVISAIQAPNVTEVVQQYIELAQNL